MDRLIISFLLKQTNLTDRCNYIVTGSIIVYRDGEQGLSMTRLNRNQNELAFGRFSVLKRETQTPGITGRHYDEYFGNYAAAMPVRVKL